MDLLVSNILPLRTSHETFSKEFNRLLFESKTLDIAVGYVSEKSLEYIADHIHKVGSPYCNLIIGMHFFDKFTYSQYALAKELEFFLTENKLGSVKLLKSFPYHGKVYCFDDGIKRTSLVGSSNLSNILPHQSVKQYEFDLVVNDQDLNTKIFDFVSELTSAAYSLCDIQDEIQIKKSSNLMEGLTGVAFVGLDEIEKVSNILVTEQTITIPLKPNEQAANSNLNTFFGKGRENKKTKIEKRRPWYEVELIVSKDITATEHYPKSSKTRQNFTVITDDGFEFECKTSGDYSKNFRSASDLKILGRWIKGRLENEGILKPGMRLTKSMLDSYGRTSISLTPIRDSNKWFLDFSRVR